MGKMVCGAFAVLVALATAGPARADQDRAATQALLDRAIKAHGGAEKLDKYRASTMNLKGKMHVMGQDLPYTGDWAVMLPDRMRVELNFDVQGMTFKVVQVLNKDKGWYSVGGKTMEMTKEMLAEAREQMHAGWVTGQLTPLKGKEYKLSPLGEVKVGDKTAAGLLISRKGYRDVSVYFDKKSGLLLKSERRSKDIMGGGKEFTEEALFQDYKEVSGMPVPHKVLLKRDGKDFLTGEVTDVKMHEKLNDEVFARP